MDLLERISSGFSNINFRKKENYYNYQSNAVIANKNAVRPIIPQISDEELALNYPAQFVYRYLNRSVIDNAIKVNPNINKILKENNLDGRYYLSNINSIIMSHLTPTSRKAKETYLNIGHSKTEKNYLYLTEAALLHDIGKIFIPPEILNKQGKLSSKERKIIELHNKLSYEILITTNLNPKVAQLAYEHHDYDKKVKRNDENQVLTIADIYSALKENRPYKKALDSLKTRVVMYDMAYKNKFDIKYMPYLNF